jgi:phosphoribosylanthranilate isomerase
MTWVKICGTTNVEDALLAVELGADALGFVFAKSKRRVTPSQVAAILPRLPKHVERIGVVYSRDAAEIAAIAEEAGLTGVQLHGGVDLPLVQELRKRLGEKVAMIQTLHWVVGTDSSQRVSEELREIAATKMIDRVLVDSRVGNAGGGTGISFDWKAARSVLHQSGKDLKIIVAGGLRPGNVAEAIQELRPWGVDVASGVEASPGRKDPDKLAAFLQITRKSK